MQIKNKKIFKNRDNQMVGLVFVLPFLIGFILVFIKMLSDGLTAAFSSATIGENGMEYAFIGFKNFFYALRIDPLFFQYAIEDIRSVLTTIPLIMIFALFVAVVLNNKIWGKTAFRVIFFLPVIITTGLLTNLDSNNAVMTTMSAASLDSAAAAGGLASIGNITTFLQQLEFSPAIIETVTKMANNVVDIITRSGVQILIFLAGIQAISPSIYEAADVEGANAWEKFWKITLPMVVPMMLVNLIYTVVECLTSTNTQLMGYINYNAFKGGKFGEAAAMSWLYFLAVIIVILIIALIVYIVSRIYKKGR